MTTAEITVHSEGLRFSAEQRRILLDSFASGATEQEFAVLIETAQARSLDPFKREIFFVKRWDSGKGREVWATLFTFSQTNFFSSPGSWCLVRHPPKLYECAYAPHNNLSARARVCVCVYGKKRC